MKRASQAYPIFEALISSLAHFMNYPPCHGRNLSPGSSGLYSGVLDVISFSQHANGWKMGEIVRDLSKHKNGIPSVNSRSVQTSLPD